MQLIDESRERSWFFGTLSEVASFTGRLAKQFLRLFALGMGFNILLACVVGYSSSDGAVWKGTIGGGAILVIGTVIVIAVAAQASTAFAAAETIRTKAAGKKILDALFGQLLGVTADKPQGELELTQSLHGMPVREVRTRLRVAGRQVLRHRVTARSIPRVGLWLANRVQRVLVWAAVRVVTSYATAGKSPDESVDLLALRGRLAEELDVLLVDRVRSTALRVIMLIGLGLTAAAWALVKLLNLIPVG